MKMVRGAAVTSWSHWLLELQRYGVVFVGWFKCHLTLSLGEDYRCAGVTSAVSFVVTWSESCAAVLLYFCIYFLYGNFYCIALVCEYSSLLYTVIFFLSLSYILLLFYNHHTWYCLTLFLFFVYIIIILHYIWLFCFYHIIDIKGNIMNLHCIIID